MNQENISIIKRGVKMLLDEYGRVDIPRYKRTTQFKHSEVDYAVKQLVIEKSLKHIIVDKNNEYIEVA